MTVEIQRLHADEWADLRALRLAALADAPEAFWATHAQESVFDEARWRDFVTAVTWFVARDDDTVVGGAGVVVMSDGGEPQVIGMWVAPNVRGRGHGSALLSSACAFARTRGDASIGLWVVRGNDAARAVYERAGFRDTGDTQALPAPRVGLEDLLRLDLGRNAGPVGLITP